MSATACFSVEMCGALSSHLEFVTFGWTLLCQWLMFYGRAQNSCLSVVCSVLLRMLLFWGVFYLWSLHGESFARSVSATDNHGFMSIFMHIWDQVDFKFVWFFICFHFILLQQLACTDEHLISRFSCVEFTFFFFVLIFQIFVL